MQESTTQDHYLDNYNKQSRFYQKKKQTIEEPSSFYHLSNNSLPTEQIEMESGEQFMCLNSAGTASPRASVSFSSLNLSMMPVQKEGEADSLNETSNDSEDIGIIEDSPMENVNEGETGESLSRETVSLFSATLGPITDHNTENEELPSTQDEASSQDGRDEEKQKKNDLGIGTRRVKILKSRTRRVKILKSRTRRGMILELRTRRVEILELRTRRVKILGLRRTRRVIILNLRRTRRAMILELRRRGVEMIVIRGKRSQWRKKMRYEKRAAKRPRLSSTGEVEEMEIKLIVTCSITFSSVFD